MNLLKKIQAMSEGAKRARKAVLDQMLRDPERVLRESFEALAKRTHSSVPTIIRTCRDLGFAGLREFKLALAQELAVSATPQHRQVFQSDDAQTVLTKVTRSAAAVVSDVRAQLDIKALERAATAIAEANRVDCYSVGMLSSFLANDLQVRLTRMGRVTNAYFDFFMQLNSASSLGKRGVAFAITHMGVMPYLLEAVKVARQQGATVIALTRLNSPLAQHADIVLGLHQPDGDIWNVTTDACMTYLTVLETLNILVAQQLGERGSRPLRHTKKVLDDLGIQTRLHPMLHNKEDKTI